MTKAHASRFRPTPTLRSARRKALVHVRLIDASGQSHDAIVQNLAASGVNVAVRGAAPAVSEVVQLILPSNEGLWGVVRWVEGNLAGIELDTSSRQVMDDTLALT